MSRRALWVQRPGRDLACAPGPQVHAPHMHLSAFDALRAGRERREFMGELSLPPVMGRSQSPLQTQACSGGCAYDRYDVSDVSVRA